MTKRTEESRGQARGGFLRRAWRLYYDGFKQMTWGRTLWVIILLKLFIMFAILRVFFFPNYLNSRFDSDKEKSDYVREQLTGGVQSTPKEGAEH